MALIRTANVASVCVRHVLFTTKCVINVQIYVISVNHKSALIRNKNANCVIGLFAVHTCNALAQRVNCTFAAVVTTNASTVEKFPAFNVHAPKNAPIAGVACVAPRNVPQRRHLVFLVIVKFALNVKSRVDFAEPRITALIVFSSASSVDYACVWSVLLLQVWIVSNAIGFGISTFVKVVRK